MEPNFQTSFIPKKPMIDERVGAPRSFGIFSVVSIFILFSILLTSAGLYFYKKIVARSLVKMESDLTLAKNRFEPSKITELQVLSRRLDASEEILAKHIAVTPIFEALQAITMKTVRYTKFSYDFKGDQTRIVTIKMSGQAIGYRSVALQSDLFAQNRNLIDPIFFNLSLDDKGSVLFDLEFMVDPLLFDYKTTLEVES
ncbi:MAG: hypothetical protein AAB786_00680 [Patescibacteria group bacterium]